MRGMGIRNPMFFIGVVEDNNDPSFQGRVRVRAFGAHGTHQEVATTDLPWAICVSGAYTADDPLPPLNAFVFGMFLDGDEAQHPLILGMIPTQYYDEMDPERDGYGVIPLENGDILAKGFTPEDFGEHQRSKSGRAEHIDETYHRDVSINAVQNQNIAGSDQTWSQPSSAYNAKYPYNRVIETARHHIELDDTPGGERIMIHHDSGAFIQIDSRGTVTERAEADRYEINIGTKHESSGHQVVTINGNAHVYVKGNKTEEVMGDYKLLVHGNSEFNVGQNLFMTSGQSLQARGATLKLEANADVMTLYAKDEIQFEADKQLNFVSANIKNTALMNYDVYSNKSIKFTTLRDIHAQASNMVLTATGLIPPSPLSGSITGTPGFSLTTPFVSILSANGSFSGLWNAGVVNAGILTATTGNIETANISASTTLVGNFGTVNTSILAAPLPISSAPGSPCAPGPGRLVGITAPSIALPTIPLLTPPTQSLLAVPPLPVNIFSGYAYPSPNGNIVDFFAGVLTSPFSVIGIPNPLTQGGYGIARVQIPEPVSAATTIQPKGYFAMGYNSGWSSPPGDTAKSDGQKSSILSNLTNPFESIASIGNDIIEGLDNLLSFNSDGSVQTGNTDTITVDSGTSQTVDANGNIIEG